MRTRSQAKVKMATQRSVSDNQDVEFEVNNQLGVEQTEGSSSESQEMERVDEINSMRARGQEQQTPEVNLSEIFNFMKQMNENLKQQFKQQDKKLEKLDKTVEEQKQQLKSIADTIRKELQEQVKSMKAEMAQQKTAWEQKFEIHQQKMTTEIENISDKHDRLQQENNASLERNRCELREIVNQNQNNTTQEIKKVEEQVAKVSTAQKDTAERLESVTMEKRRRLEEINNSLTTMKEGQERLQRKLNELDVRPANRPVGTSVSKEISFNGRDHFPMEFLKELTELYETYYVDDNTKWIGNHLTEEAAIWWRIVRGQVNTYDEFREVFIEKYWGQVQQEKVRDRLEYGKYHRDQGKSMIQYMEHSVLECRQLLPVLSDRHLIKKLARHYDRDIQIAVVTRGIQTIGGFESLLREYMSIAPRYNNQHNNQYERRKESAEQQTVKAETRSGGGQQHNVHKTKPWKRPFKPTVCTENNEPAVQCIVTEQQQPQGIYNEGKPGTSKGLIA